MNNKLFDKNIYKNINRSEKKEVFGWLGPSGKNTIEKLILNKKPKIIIEIGTWLGASAIHMAKITEKINLKTKIYCVDTWLGAEEFWTWKSSSKEHDLKLKNGYPQIYYEFISNVVEHKLEKIITPIPNTSRIGSIILKKNKIKADLIYIDGSHDYFDVKLDIKSYLPILKNNGIMFGDDIKWKGVNKAVKECFENFKIENNFWIVEKSKSNIIL